MDGDDRCELNKCLVVRSVTNQYEGYLDLLVFQMRLPGPSIDHEGGKLAWSLVIPKSTAKEPIILTYVCDGTDKYWGITNAIDYASAVVNNSIQFTQMWSDADFNVTDTTNGLIVESAVDLQEGSDNWYIFTFPAISNVRPWGTPDETCAADISITDEDGYTNTLLTFD